MRELIERTVQWHVKWTTHVHEWAEKQAHPLPLRIPSMCFSLKGGRAAGWYKQGYHQCFYSLGYICTCNEAYEEVVAHEVCHAYQWQILPKCKWHGEFFKFLLNNVCGFHKAKTGHNFRVKPTKQLESIFLLNEQAIIATVKDVQARMQDVVIKDTRTLPIRSPKTGRYMAVRDT